MAKNRPAKKDNNKEKKGKKEKGVGKRMKKEATTTVLSVSGTTVETMRSNCHERQFCKSGIYSYNVFPLLNPVRDRDYPCIIRY